MLNVQASKDKKDILKYVLINVGVFVIMFAINSVYPFSWDDRGIVEGFTLNKWNIADIFTYTYNTYYLQWSGKLIPLSIVLFFNLIDKMAYNIVNSIMYVILANTIYLFFWRKRFDCWVISAIYAALWLFIPWFGTVVFWVDGTVEYLWMLIPVLWLGTIYYREYFGDTTQNVSSLGILLLGFFAGCGLEATGSALVITLFIMLIIKLFNERGIHIWEVVGLLGTLIGFGSLMLAPGNYKRAANVSELSTLYSNVFYRIARESYFMILYLGVLLGIDFALIMLLYKCKKNKECKYIDFREEIKNFYENCKEPLVFIAIALVSVYVMTFVNAFAVRIFMTPAVLLIISCGIAVRRISETSEGYELLHKYKNIIKILLLFVYIYVVVQMLTAYLFCFYTGEPVTKNIQYTNSINDVRLFN